MIASKLLNSDQFRRRTPADYVERLEPDEVFVFGSNSLGWHGGGAAAMAHMFFSAMLMSSEAVYLYIYNMLGTLT